MAAETFAWYSALSLFLCVSQWSFDLRAWWMHAGWRTVFFCFSFPVLFTPFIGLVSAWQSARTTRVVGATRMLVLSEDGLHQSFGASNAQQAWKAIQRVEESGRAYYLFLGKRVAIVLPKRAFSSTEQVDSCRQFLKNKVAQAVKRG